METTLHQQLKELYTDDPSQREVVLDGFRIDAVVDERLIEIQCASLSAIRDKIARLVAGYQVSVVKPLCARKYLITRKSKRGKIASRRYSPKRETFYHLFDELVHFVRVFPHENLSLEILLTEQEEIRIPAPKRRWRSKGYKVEQRSLREVTDRMTLQTPADLLAMLPDDLPTPFTTADVASLAGIPRWLAQKAAYCLRMTGAVDTAGKVGNAILYRPRRKPRRKRKRGKAA